MHKRISVVVLAIGFVVSTAHADDTASSHWVASWASAQQLSLFAPAQVLENQTVRQIVRVSRGGSAVRVRLSNVLGTKPLQIDAASVGVRAQEANVGAGTLRALRFGGAASIEIPAGAVAVSDPVALRVGDQSDLAISLFVRGATAADTQHTQAMQTSYISGPGDFSASEAFVAASTITSWYWLSGVDVLRPGTKAIVAFGDSITDGYGSTVDANARWPDALLRRLLARDEDLAVVDAGISGNRVLTDEIGPNAQARLDRDLLTLSGAAYAILLEGINDIGIPKGGADFLPASVSLRTVSAEQIIAGYLQIARRAHAAGIAIYAATLTPMGGSSYDDETNESKREAVNAWLRKGCGFDGLIDFDAATRDPNAPAQLQAAFDSGDHLHPNDAGYKAMANAIDLRLFRERRSAPRAASDCQ